MPHQTLFTAPKIGATSTDEERTGALWRAYADDRSLSNRNALADAYRGYVYSIAIATAHEIHRGDLVDDLAQEGLIAVIRCIPLFDPSRGIKFVTFAGWRIGGAMRDYLRATDELSRTDRKSVTLINQATESIRRDTGRQATDGEICQALNIDAATLAHAREAARFAGRQPIDVEGPSGDFDERAELATQPAADVAAEIADWWAAMTRGMNRADRFALQMYYREGLRMREIGQALGVSESRVSQRITEVVADLRGRGSAAIPSLN
jgi:RNA polymerase sigma factor for flagellar operon FliA